MAKQKALQELSSQELYEIARQREAEEWEAEQQERQSHIDALREQRRELTTEYKKALAALDREIKRLGGRTPRGSAGSGRRAGRSGDQSKTIVEIIAAHGPISSTDLKARLADKGVDVKHLSQQLNYLKRRGMITSPSRAVYAIA